MQTAPPTRILACGDTALTIEFGEAIDRHLSALVLALADRMDRQAIVGVVELVPTFRSLMVHYDPILLPQAELKRRLVPLLAGLEAAQEAKRRWRIPACYHESLAPDLSEVAQRTGLTPANVVERHSATTFHVYMVGFLPGYPYMGDLPPELVLPRRENPRTAVPPGSVAIATTQTAVYTLESPGGWHLIRRTPALLWDARQARPAILAAGDKVVFEPVSVADYESMLARAASGEFRLRPEAA
jgi:inhibitor of KinA